MMKKTLVSIYGSGLFYLYLGLMSILLIAIEIAQLCLSTTVTCLLKTIPAVLTAIMGIIFLIKKGIPKDKNKYLAWAVIVVGIADILLCLFVGTIPLMNQVPGFMAFCVLQILIMMWLGINKRSIIIHSITVGIMVIGGIVAHQASLYTLTALVNLGLLLGNLIQGIILNKQKSTLTSKLYLGAAIGIAVCDYSIMIRTLISTSFIQSIATELAWLGYIPFLILLLLTLISSRIEA